MPSSSSSACLRGRGPISSKGWTSVMPQEDIVQGKERKEQAMAFEVPPLPYEYGALEPTIDEQTMRLHHDKHHQAYVDNANKALDGTELADKPVEHVLPNLDILPERTRAAVGSRAGG